MDPNADAGRLPPDSEGEGPQSNDDISMAASASRKRKAACDLQRPDDKTNAQQPDSKGAAASSSTSASASLVASAAAAALTCTADGRPLSASQSVTTVASTLLLQPAAAPIPLSACAAEAEPPSSLTPTSAAAAAAVPMLRCMAECRDVQFALMELLPLEDLAALNTACRSWRRWLLNSPLIDGLQFEFEGMAARVILLAQSQWARQLVTMIHLQTCHRNGSRFLLDRIAPAETELAVCDQLLSALPRFTRLHTLLLVMCDAFAATSLWPTCLTALSGSLRHLRLKGNRQAAPVNSILAHVGRLRRLTALVILEVNCKVARELDLAQLPSLPCLRKFELLICRDEPVFRCTPQQVQHLAQCSQLALLTCGSWMPDERKLDDDGWQLPPVAQQIDEGIATLVRGLTLQPEAAATAASASEPASSSSAAPISAAAACRLYCFDLEDTVMTAAVWQYVSQLTRLTELMPGCWCSDMKPQQWSRLADFKQLRKIHIRSSPDDDEDDSLTPLRTDHFLPSLLQCTQLRSVALAGPTLSLSADQLDGIARLALLHSLALHSVEVESVAPLVRATKLQLLQLSFCRGPPVVVDFRRSLPPLPALTDLMLEDRCRITADQAAPLNAALFARMPKLTSANFEQI